MESPSFPPIIERGLIHFKLLRSQVSILFTALVLMAVPLTALAGAGVLGAEAGLGVWWLGRVFERFDVSSEPTV